MHEPLVTVVMRSYNEGWALRETLPALRRQNYSNWELIVFDSGSTDDSVELIREFQPRTLVQLLPHEYHPSRVMNQAMGLARTDRVIFLNADATPNNHNWLRPLALALEDPATAAVYGRQIPRPDCPAVFACDYERCFGPDREVGQWDHFFSMASSGIRRDIWSRRGFLEVMRYSEDDEYTRWCRAQGHRIAYCPESVAMHSHSYTPRQAYKRSFGEAWALAAVWRGSPAAFSPARTILFGWLNDARRDLLYCLRHGRPGQWPHALRIRWQQRQGRLAGFRAGWGMHRHAEPARTSPLPLSSPERALP